MSTGRDTAREDRELIDSFLANASEAVFRRLYRRHAGRLYALVTRLLAPSSDAEEVFQECWVRIVEHLRRFSGRSSFATWTSGIALNCAREWRRRRARAFESTSTDPEDESPGRSPDIALDLEQALAQLPPGYREVLLLHDVHGHTHAEIGQLLSISSGTSKSQLSRARRAARSLLNEGVTP